MINIYFSNPNTERKGQQNQVTNMCIEKETST